MKEARFRYYKGQLSSQFVVDKLMDKQGVRYGNLNLQPRYYLTAPAEITEEEYRLALAARLSPGSVAWQQRFISGDDPGRFMVHPHVIQQGEVRVELEVPGRPPSAVLADEIYAEFPEADPDSAYRGWDFIAQKDGKFHGRVKSLAWCRVLELDADEKERRLASIASREKNAASGCLPAGFSPAGCLPLLAGPGCAVRGCALPGCGLLALAALLSSLFFLFRSCNQSGTMPSPRVVHDTIYVKDGMQVKEFVDSTLVSKTDAILLPNVQFYTNSARLLPYSIRPIQELAAYLDSHPAVNAVIKGHTDDVGEEAANLQLSQARAEAVRSVLISLGIRPDRITAVGYGESAPKVRGQSVEARALNRRVEVELKNTESAETRRSEKEGRKP